MLTLHISEEGGRFVARCPELEVTGTGSAKHEAFTSLCDSLLLRCRFKKNNSESDENVRLVLAHSKSPAAWFAEEQLKVNDISAS